MRLLVVSSTTDEAELRSRADDLAAVPRGGDTVVDLVGAAVEPRRAPVGMGRLEAETAAIMAATRSGASYDGVVIDSVSDGAADVLRSRFGVPVVGAGTAVIAIARMLGGNAAMAAGSVAMRQAAERTITVHGGHGAIGALDVVEPDGPALDALGGWAHRARADGHGVLVLGEPAWEGHAATLAGRTGLPVLAPGALALKLVEAIVDLGLRHAPAAYLAPAVVLDGLIERRTRVVVRPPIPVPATEPRPYRLKVVVPISGMRVEDLSLRAAALAPGLLHATTRVDYRSLSDSSNSADGQYDAFVLDLFCAEEELRAASEGYDGVLVDSTTDSGIGAVRTHLGILALGPGEACWSLASVLGERFTILSMERKWQHFFRKNLRLTGFEEHLTSIEDIGTAPDPVRLFEGKEELMERKLVEAAWRGIDLGSDTVIIGSTTMHQALPALAAALPVPVLSPGRVGVRLAEMLLDLGIRQDAPSAMDDAASRLFEPKTRAEPPLVQA